MQDLEVIDTLHLFEKNDRKGELQINAQTFNEYLVFALNNTCHIINTENKEHFTVRMSDDDWYISIPFLNAARVKQNG